jgi:hypothetical protein
MYFYVNNSDLEGFAELYAPGDLSLENIGIRKQFFQGDAPQTTYDLTFSVCADVKILFMIVRSLTHPDILGELETGGCTLEPGAPNEEWCGYQLPTPIPITAGEVIGTAGAPSAGVDFALVDYRIETGRSAFANPDQWCEANSRPIHSMCFSACPIDYMESSVAGELNDLIYNVSKTVQRVAEPRCGNGVYLDVKGSAQGYWWQADINTTGVFPETIGLYLGPHDIVPSLMAISIGETLQNSTPSLPSDIYAFESNPTGMINRKFSEITDENTYCIERIHYGRDAAISEDNSIQNRILLLQKQTGGQRIELELQESNDCSALQWSFTANSVVFER